MASRLLQFLAVAQAGEVPNQGNFAAWCREISGEVDSLAPGGGVLGECLNVRDFGAAGDNVADDTAAIQSAVNAALALPTGGAVCFPPGTYRATAQITLGATGVALVLAGVGSTASIIVFDPPAPIDDGILAPDASNLVVRDLVLQGAESLATPGVGRILSLQGPTTGPSRVERCTFLLCKEEPSVGACVALHLGDVNECTIRDNLFADNGPFPLDEAFFSAEVAANVSSGTANNRIRVENNEIVGARTVYSVDLHDCSSSWVVDNYIDQGNHGSEPNSGMGITFFPTLQPARMTDNHVNGNVVVNCWGMGLYLSFWDDGEVCENVFVNTVQTQIDPSFSTGAIGLRGRHNVVDANQIETSGKAGISWNGDNVVSNNQVSGCATAGLRTFAVEPASGSVISGNRVRLSGQRGIAVDSTGIAANVGIVVVDNTIETSAGTGIEFVGDANFCEVSGNIITGCTLQAMALGVGAHYTVHGNNVHNNLDKGIDCRAPQSTLTGNVCISNALQGIFVTLANCVVSDNVVSICDPGVHLTGTAAAGIVEGNQIIGNGVNGGANGGLLLGAAGQITVKNNQITGNTGGNLVDGATDTLRGGNRLTATGLMQGTAVLNAAAGVVVATTEVVAGDQARISLRRIVAGAAPGAVWITAASIVPGVSFTIFANALDVGTVAWSIDH